MEVELSKTGRLSIMSIAIMQPYLFPYLGYFQLINAVQRFVIHDDVQYIKGGWINRNRILQNGNASMYTFSLKKASSYALINEREFSDHFLVEKNRFLRVLYAAYKNAAYRDQVLSLVEDVLDIKETQISKGITLGLMKICDYLNIDTPFLISSEILKNNNTKGEERVLELNHSLSASIYINTIGGGKLYSKERFAHENIELRFLQTSPIQYKQFGNEFVPNLSIIDVLMFNPIDKVQSYLEDYMLI
jgi:hypothetical protein